MKRSRSIAAALSLVLLAAVGACSSGDSPGNTAGGSSSSSATSDASTPAQTPTTPKTLTTESSSKAEKYINTSYKGSSWLKSVEKVSVDDNKLVAETKLGSTKKDKASASELCRALSAYQVAEEDGFMGVVIKSKDGKTLVNRTSLAKGC